MHGEKFSRGLGKFHGVEHIPPDEVPDEEYPFVLSTGRRLFHYHTGTMTRKGMLDEQMPADYLEVNCADAKNLGIADGDKVQLSSRRGSIEIPAKIADTVPPGVVFASFHFSETPVNQLTNPKFDAISKIPEFKVCAVNVTK
jgi:formate dehydrogenase major subunit